MKKKKNLLIIMTLCGFVFLCSLGITYSILTVKSDKIVNTFIVGENVIEISETFEPPVVLIPGVSFRKEPIIQNTGNISCYVRARADFSDSKAEEFCEKLDIGNKWIDGKDGYYYYTELLEVGKKTDPLFTTVTIKTKKATGDDYQKDELIDFDILVYAESVYANGQESYQKAWGAFGVTAPDNTKN